MIKILKDTELEALEANINGTIRSEPYLKVKSVDVTTTLMKDYFEDGRICNQWVEYLAVIIFEN